MTWWHFFLSFLNPTSAVVTFRNKILIPSLYDFTDSYDPYFFSFGHPHIFSVVKNLKWHSTLIITVFTRYGNVNVSPDPLPPKKSYMNMPLEGLVHLFLYICYVFFVECLFIKLRVWWFQFFCGEKYFIKFFIQNILGSKFTRQGRIPNYISLTENG